MFRNKLLIALALLIGFIVQANAASGIVYVDSTACVTGITKCSGTTDTTTATISGTVAVWTTGTAAITLDTNTDFTSVAGCSAGTCDGSQAIFLDKSTVSNQKIFWLSSYTGCTGSGACVATVSQNVTCTTCTGSDWGIGGRYTYPSGATGINVIPALRAGDTLQFNNDPATRTAIYVTQATSGSSSGYIRVIGKAGVDHPYLHITSGDNSVINNGGFTNWWFENLKMQSDGATSVAVIVSGGNGPVFKNIKVTGTGAGTSNCIGNTGVAFYIIDSELTGCGGDGINSSASNNTIVGNYIHANGGDGTELSAAAPTATIANNIISANGGRGLYLSSGSVTTQQYLVAVLSNTFYANTSPNIEVADSDYRVLLRNNISSNASANTVKWAAGTAETFSVHSNNDFFGAGGISGLTTNSTETTSDPLLSNPASGAFVIPSSSPAAGTGYPGTILSTSTGYIDMGAVQHQGSGGSCIGC